jgi:hypothetical protein
MKKMTTMTPPQTLPARRRTGLVEQTNRLASGGEDSSFALTLYIHTKPCSNQQQKVVWHDLALDCTLLVAPAAFAHIRRGGSAAPDGAAADEEADEAAKHRAAAAALADDNDITPAQAAKKARVSAMFEQLHQTSTGSTNKLSKSTISLASLCSNTDPKKKRNTDMVS